MLLGIYSTLSLFPGPSPRVFSYSLPNAIGAIVGGLTTSGLKLFTKPEALSDETIKCAKKAVGNVLEGCNTLQTLKFGRHKYTREGACSAEIIKYAFSTTPIVALERAARLAALKVHFFVNPINIRDNDLFKRIKLTTKSGRIYTELLEKYQNRNGYNVKAHLNVFFDEVERILIREMRASDLAPAPTWIDSIGFGVQWGTQIGLTWLGRYVAWQYWADYIPKSPGNLAYYGCFLGAVYLYFEGLAYYSRYQLNNEHHLRSIKPDLRKYLTGTTIKEICAAAKTHLLINDELRAAHEDDLIGLEDKLLVLAGLKLRGPH